MERQSNMADKKLMERKKIMNKKRPHFHRDGFRKRIRITSEWRKPRGIHNKMRNRKAGHRRVIMPGFRTQVAVRGLHLATGLRPVLIHSIKDIQYLNKGTDGAIIGKDTGTRKRLELISELNKQGIKILNLKDNYTQIITEKMKLEKAEREARKTKKQQKKPKKEEKKEKEMTPEEKEAQEKKEKDKILTKAQK